MKRFPFILSFFFLCASSSLALDYTPERFAEISKTAQNDIAAGKFFKILAETQPSTFKQYASRINQIIPAQAPYLMIEVFDDVMFAYGCLIISPAFSGNSDEPRIKLRTSIKGDFEKISALAKNALPENASLALSDFYDGETPLPSLFMLITFYDGKQARFCVVSNPEFIALTAAKIKPSAKNNEDLETLKSVENLLNSLKSVYGSDESSVFFRGKFN